MIKKFYWYLFICVLTAFSLTNAFAQNSGDNLWKETKISSVSQSLSGVDERPQSFRSFSLNRAALKAVLTRAPSEKSDSSMLADETILTLPMPDGSFARFRIEKSPVVEEGLAAKFPELDETYRGQGIDDPTATVRFDLLPSGFHSMILSSKGTFLVDPYTRSGEPDLYISYAKSDAPRTENFTCNFRHKDSVANALSTDRLLSQKIFSRTNEQTSPAETSVSSGTQLRTYRLALAATGEYSAAAGGGTVSGALAAEVLIINRVNAVYERDLAIHMNIIANNDQITYLNGATDPYTNNDGDIMLDQNISNLNIVIGSSNFDIGHVFSTGGGGVAYLGVPCTADKAGGVTGLPNPVGDAFALDFVAHEMGHQFGADHSFNTSCGNNRWSPDAFEPGSGVTIMGYAGVCGSQDLAIHSIDTFHVKSLQEIVAYTQTDVGNTCASKSTTGNTPPTVTTVGGNSFNIPKQTPFALTASATDAQNDSITFDWQEYDLGAAATVVPNSDSDGNARPIFRSYSPTLGGTRLFPSLQYILNNANVPASTYSCGRPAVCMTGEILPSITRTMNFQVIARDNHSLSGGINTATAAVNVTSTAGPFIITAPETAATFAGNSTQTVTWNVANTTAAPVSAANVKISLSADGGQTFPYVLAESTPNDGSQAVTIPNVATTQARIKVEAVGNIFFDISGANLTITAVQSTVRPYLDFDGDLKTDISIFRPAAGEWWYLKSSNGGNSAVQFGNSADVMAPADFTGDGKTDIAFWRPSTGEWFVIRSEDGSYFSFPFGTNGDIPAPGDYDGDGKADAAVFRPSNQVWYISKSRGGYSFQQFGISTDKPVAADYDGDGRTDIAIYRQSAGEWWVNRSRDGLTAGQFGSPEDKAVPGDYTGDGKTDYAVWRPSTGEWFVLKSENGNYYSVPFGTGGDVPAPGDYDGDGKFDTAVFRPSQNVWYVNRTTAGILITQFGAIGDTPLASAYVR